MSIEAMACVLHHSTLGGTPKLVLLGIANHQGDGGAWPTVATLAKYAHADERTVQRAIAACVAAEELRVVRNKGGAAATRDDRRPNRYTVLVSCPTECDGSMNHRLRGDISTTPRPDGVTSDAKRGDISTTPLVPDGVTPVSPEPSFEPSINREDLNSKKQPPPNEDPIARHQRAQREKAEANMERMRSEKAPPDHELNRRKLKELRAGKKGSTIEP